MKIDTIGFIMKVEDGQFDPENPEDVAALQAMVDSGLAFNLQGFWIRFVRQMVGLGVINLTDNKPA